MRLLPELHGNFLFINLEFIPFGRVNYRENFTDGLNLFFCGSRFHGQDQPLCLSIPKISSQVTAQPEFQPIQFSRTKISFLNRNDVVELTHTSVWIGGEIAGTEHSAATGFDVAG